MIFIFGGNEALSAKKTFAELLDDWLRGGGIGLVVAAEGKVVSPRDPRRPPGLPLQDALEVEADHGAPMPGHPTQGDTRQSSRLRKLFSFGKYVFFNSFK